MAPQVSDEMHTRIIIWQNEKHLSPQEMGVAWLPASVKLAEANIEEAKEEWKDLVLSDEDWVLTQNGQLEIMSIYLFPKILLHYFTMPY
jgi:hypothetical protein